MASVRRFQDLVAWQKSMELCGSVYELSSFLPDTERYGITSQLRRAAVSIPANIAEGYGRETTADLLRFLRTSRGSLFLLQTLLQLCVNLRFVPESAPPWELLAETDRVLQGLIRSLVSKQTEL